MWSHAEAHEWHIPETTGSTQSSNRRTQVPPSERSKTTRGVPQGSRICTRKRRKDITLKNNTTDCSFPKFCGNPSIQILESPSRHLSNIVNGNKMHSQWGMTNYVSRSTRSQSLSKRGARRRLAPALGYISYVCQVQATSGASSKDVQRNSRQKSRPVCVLISVEDVCIVWCRRFAKTIGFAGCLVTFRTAEWSPSRWTKRRLTKRQLDDRQARAECETDDKKHERTSRCSLDVRGED